MNKYRATMILMVDLEIGPNESKHEAAGVVLDEIKQLMSPELLARVAIRTSFHRVEEKVEKGPSLKTLGTFGLADVFDYIAKRKYREVEIGGKIYRVKMNSSRYSLFQKNNACVCCGIVGTEFLLQTHSEDVNPHFNLYAKKPNGSLVLMTKDHIIPRSRGGSNSPDNYQTMCEHCNSAKGDLEIDIPTLRERLGIQVANSEAA